MNPIAQASGHTAGFVKVVWEGERPVGMAAVGGGVSHLVSVAGLLLAGEYTPEKLHSVMIAHPTLDEILPLALNAPRAVPQ
jgi:dihydrolipoamide dehydrogenase